MDNHEHVDVEAYNRKKLKELAEIKEKAFQLEEELNAFKQNVSVYVRIPVEEAIINIYRLYKSIAEIETEIEKIMKRIR
jgi:hypothetical protein